MAPVGQTARIAARAQATITMYFEIPSTNVRVLGSMHMVPAGALAVPPWAADAYNWCEALVHEHLNDDALAIMRADSPLSDVISPGAWRAIETLILDGHRRAILDGLRPWAAALHLTVWAQQLEPGIELAFLNRRAIDQKPLDTLETASELRAAFDSVPVREVEEVIVACLRDASIAQSRFVHLHAAWLARDRAAMYAVASGSPFGASAAMWNAGIVRRNRDWASKLQPLLATNRRTLVVVGAMHLCGPGNLEEWLGVKLEPLLASE